MTRSGSFWNTQPTSGEWMRSSRWFEANDMRGFAHRQRMQQAGFRRSDFVGRPVVAIVNTWSELSPCHVHLRTVADAVRRGVWQSGGIPLELPALSLGEVVVKPTTMMYRNLLAMEVEELLRSHPIDGAILLGGCDKTVPGLLMGAISVDLPALFCPAGPMLNGRWKGSTVGAGTHTRQFWDEFRAGRITSRQWIELETPMTRSAGTCNTMGTASTMTSIAEAIGLALPGSTAIPAADSAHLRMATDCGQRIVGMIREDLKPSRILTAESFANGLIAALALGGSTNAAIHQVAIAARARVPLTLDQMDAEGRRTPVLANLRPSGTFLMEDFYFAGGLPALLDRLRDRLHLECMTVTGRTLGENIAGACAVDDDVIRPLDNPVTRHGALAALGGNIAPNGCVIKPSAASPHLFRHRGPALVFESMEEMSRRIDDPELAVDENTVLVLKGAGPVGAPGMPEWGALPIPRKLLEKGVRDMVRLSDARMSGTHYGTCVLHISPESAIGGPFALLATGDIVELDIERRTLNMLVDDAELTRRIALWKAPPRRFTRGYGVLLERHITQAERGCDFDFLEAGPDTPEPQIY